MTICDFCSKRRQNSHELLCARCLSKPHVARMYEVNVIRPIANWNEHLQKLARRAFLKLPLFPKSTRKPDQHEQTREQLQD